METEDSSPKPTGRTQEDEQWAKEFAAHLARKFPPREGIDFHIIEAPEVITCSE